MVIREIKRRTPAFKQIFADQHEQLVSHMKEAGEKAFAKDIAETKRSNELVRFLFAD